MPKSKKSSEKAKTAEMNAKGPIGPYIFKEVEESVMDFWAKKKIYPKAKKLAAKRAKKSRSKPFYFLDGPPYTSGKVHIGTAWNKSLKDSILRYKRMQGIDVWDRAGYDMHGLPTEHATEKKLGIKNKDEIMKFGVENFVNECRKLSIENMLVMNRDFKRLGVWMDLDDAYQSVKDEFIEGEWWLIKKAHENKRLYQGKKTMHWCSHCETALAKHELEYKEITDKSIFFKFKVLGSNKKFANEYLIVWTTTPWTLAFNLAVMVNPELEYVRCEVDSGGKGGKEGKEIWILAKALAGPVVQAVADRKLKIIDEMMGEELKGLKYIHPWLDDIPSLKRLKQENDKVHTVVLSSEYVDTTAGSGLVHCAPGCGPEDYEVGHREGLPAYNEISEEGVFPASMGIFKGLVAKKDDKEFIKALEEKGALIATTPVEHDYAHCWRCHNPVVFRTTKQWFFKIEDLKENMKELNKNINWVPDWAGSRQFHSWLDNLRDNSITKQRFWGTPLPIWVCGAYWEGEESKGCGNYTVIGSKAELRKLAGKLPKDLHKPWIDDVRIKCQKCRKMMRRVPDILDVWVDAGCVSWICLGYPQKKELFEKMFPADFILEGKDQIRGWFNLLFVASMVSMQKPSFKAAYMHGYVNDSQGRKMSKSEGNYILPEEVISKYGADSFRYYSIGGANAGTDLNYNFEDVALKHKNLNVLWNMHKFLLEMKDQGLKMPKKPELGLEEKYILSKMNSAIKNATEKFDSYNLDEIPAIVEDLYLELSRTYIQLVRDKSSVGGEEEKQAVFYTIYDVMMSAVKMLAPLAPFISERIYQDFREGFGLEEESVHLTEWPKADAKAIDGRLEQDFDVAKSAIQSILAARERAQLGIRWPLKEAVVVGVKEEVMLSIRRLEELIRTQTNVKKIIIAKEEPRIKVKVRADFKKIGPEFGEDSAKLIAQFSMMPADAVLKKINEVGYQIFRVDDKEFRITREHLMVEKEAPKNLVAGEFRHGDLYIDTTRTEELEAEGYAREIMRRVQQMRKEAGLKKPDRIRLCIRTDELLAEMISGFKGMIKEKVGADEIRIISEERLKEYKVSKEEKIKGKSFLIGFDVVS
ncbi:isoleucine--tRNA ligase [Candidatus Woesearchaeota archaeon CG10_big_fil_rev_8_21_14_0_10_44_13]|nr:MAG: isoleucine--tRNA ligase [Candidatus Woesearchaeota archaeon CG10_big_fil_rev_8_21_14_0_10_44_13]